MKVTVTLGEINNAPLVSAWERYCEKYGVNYWCLNEGLATSEREVSIDIEDAQLYGLVK